MTRQTKIILGVVAGILVLCLITCVAAFVLFRSVGSRVTQSVDQDPATVETTAQEIASFDLPEGFQPESSMDLLGVKMAFYSNRSTNQVIMLFQLPEMAETNVEQIRQIFEQSSGRNFSNMETIEQRELTVRGQPATLVVQQGVDENDENREIRQLLLVFQGQNGTVMLSAFGPLETWDQDVYERMIESIR